jgi:hypothetical protein
MRGMIMRMTLKNLGGGSRLGVGVFSPEKGVGEKGTGGRGSVGTLAWPPVVRQREGWG